MIANTISPADFGPWGAWRAVLSCVAMWIGSGDYYTECTGDEYYRSFGEFRAMEILKAAGWSV